MGDSISNQDASSVVPKGAVNTVQLTDGSSDLKAGTGVTVDDGKLTAVIFSGDGGLLSNVPTGGSDTLDTVVNRGNDTSVTILLNNSTTALSATGNIEVTSGMFIGDGGLLSNLQITETDNLEVVVNRDNVTSNTVQFTNSTTAIYATGNIEVTSGMFIGDGGLLSNLQITETDNLEVVVNRDNVTSNTVQFTNTTNSLVASGNVIVSGSGELNVASSNLVMDMSVDVITPTNAAGVFSIDCRNRAYAYARVTGHSGDINGFNMSNFTEGSQVIINYVLTGNSNLNTTLSSTSGTAKAGYSSNVTGVSGEKIVVTILNAEDGASGVFHYVNGQKY